MALADSDRGAGAVPSLDLAKLGKVRLRDYVIRFAFGGAISVAAAVVGQAFGARAGGLFLGFPAILPASLTLVQEKEGTRKADHTAAGAILGGLGLIAFAVAAWGVLERMGAPAALLSALGAWQVSAVVAYLIACHLHPAVCRDG